MSVLCAVCLKSTWQGNQTVQCRQCKNWYLTVVVLSTDIPTEECHEYLDDILVLISEIAVLHRVV
jgi:hypothetical protein